MAYGVGVRSCNKYIGLYCTPLPVKTGKRCSDEDKNNVGMYAIIANDI